MNISWTIFSFCTCNAFILWYLNREDSTDEYFIFNIVMSKCPSDAESGPSAIGCTKSLSVL